MAIFFDNTTKTFYLEGKNYTYAFFINNYGYAEHLYFGKRIERDVLFYTRTTGDESKIAMVPGETGNAPFNSYQRFPSELAFFGTGDYREPTVHIENADGSRLTELLYEGHRIVSEKPKMATMPSLSGKESLILYLGDKLTGFKAELHYTVYDDASVLTRRAVYKNEGEGDVKLLRAYSFNLSFPDNNYDTLTLHGGWSREREPERRALSYGSFVIDSKKACSSAALNPFIAILSKDATEDSGEAYGINLVYSSSYVIKAECVADGTLNLLGGINDFSFSWKLSKGEELEVPEVVFAYSDEGIGGMSRAFHKAYKEHLIPERFTKKPRPIVLNTWEGMFFDFNTEKLIAAAEAIKGTGIDTFVLDDGWFGKRDDDTSSLGDWFVNENKLKNGLGPIIDKLHSIGLKFGIWFEPEMISEESELYRAHPEFAIKAPGRIPTRCRHQLVIDLTRKDARDYIVNSVNNILQNNKIDYVKWDYNRNAAEFFSELLPAERQGEFAHRYALGLYDILNRIINANPDIFFEGCAGGGARFDPAILAYFPDIWTSDNPDAEARTLIQYGTSIVYPLPTISCHVAKPYPSRNISLATRGDIASFGAFGYELDSTKLNEDEKAQIRAQIEEYKRGENLLLNGELFRICSPAVSNYFAYMLVSEDKKEAMLVAYRRLFKTNDTVWRIKARGLSPKKKYYIPELNLILSGATLMNVGIPLKFPEHDFASSKLHFEEK